MTLFFRSTLLLLLISLTACSYVSRPIAKNGHNDYLTAKSIAPLRIPPGVSTNGFTNEYPVSDSNYPPVATNVDIVPPGLYNKS